RRSNDGTLPQEIGAAGEVEPFPQEVSDLPRRAGSKVALHLLNRRSAPSSKEGIGRPADRTKSLRICFLVLLLLCLSWPKPLTGSDRPPVAGLDSIGITVSDVDRSVDFFSRVLSFEKVSDTEIAGSDYEHLQGLFGVRARVV